MGKADFNIEIYIDGYGAKYDRKTVAVMMKFPKDLETKTADYIKNIVVNRTRAGLDMDGQPFAPKKDGTPSTLTDTGAMLEGVFGGGYTTLKKYGGGFQVPARHLLINCGITCAPNGEWEHYPFVNNNGVSAERYRQRNVDRIDRKLSRKIARLNRKKEDLAKADPARAKYEHLLDTIDGIERDMTQLMKDRIEAANAKVVGRVARRWWGLDDQKSDKLFAALSAWVKTMIAGVVAISCNPGATKISDVEREARRELVQFLGA